MISIEAEKPRIAQAIRLARGQERAQFPNSAIVLSLIVLAPGFSGFLLLHMFPHFSAMIGQIGPWREKDKVEGFGGPLNCVYVF